MTGSTGVCHTCYNKVLYPHFFRQVYIKISLQHTSLNKSFLPNMHVTVFLKIKVTQITTYMYMYKLLYINEKKILLVVFLLLMKLTEVKVHIILSTVFLIVLPCLWQHQLYRNKLIIPMLFFQIFTTSRSTTVQFRELYESLKLYKGILSCMVKGKRFWV